MLHRAISFLNYFGKSLLIFSLNMKHKARLHLNIFQTKQYAHCIHTSLFGLIIYMSKFPAKIPKASLKLALIVSVDNL